MIDPKAGLLYLVPTPISDESGGLGAIPPATINALLHSKLLFVEHPKPVRRILKALVPDREIDSYRWIEIGKGMDEEEWESGLMEVAQGQYGAVLSEAGYPCIGDPGYLVVKRAHEFGIRVVPQGGPNSFLMGLMASGFNGQAFSFHGYLPIKEGPRTSKISEMESTALRTNEPQVFMETPYRNQALFDLILKVCKNETGLSVAEDITGSNERVVTASIRDWKKMNLKISKIPAVFTLGKL